MPYSILRPLLFSLNPETAHLLAKTAAKFVPKAVLGVFTDLKSKFLRTKLGDTPLRNPIGLAGGFDKNAEMVEFLKALGFGFLELGSVTALPCHGRPKPRIFRITADESLINRMGLPNIGAEAFAQKLMQSPPNCPYGVNIAKTPDFAQNKNKIISGIDDFITTFRRLYFLGCYTVLNLSCPNSEDGRSFEDPKLMSDLLTEIVAVKKEIGSKKPLLVKLSPDSDTKTFARIIDTALKFDIDGFVLTNTTTSREGLKTSQNKIQQVGAGGLSGRALRDASNVKLRLAFEIVGIKKTLIGVGGIMSFEDVLAKLACGASLFQIYTGFTYNGPLFIRDLNRRLIEFCKKSGVNNYKELVGQQELKTF